MLSLQSCSSSSQEKRGLWRVRLTKRKWMRKRPQRWGLLFVLSQEKKMNELLRKVRMTREQLRDVIESSDNLLAGFELRQDERGPWVWIHPVPALDYRPQGPNVSHCIVSRPCSDEDVKCFSHLLSAGDIVLRVVYVRTHGANRFAVLRLE